VALVAVTLRVEEPPALMDDGVAEILTVGGVCVCPPI
jgi:hypothetical protein